MPGIDQFGAHDCGKFDTVARGDDGSQDPKLRPIALQAHAGIGAAPLCQTRDGPAASRANPLGTGEIPADLITLAQEQEHLMDLADALGIQAPEVD